MFKVYERWPEEWDQPFKDNPDLEDCGGWIDTDDDVLECERGLDHPGKCATSFIFAGPVGAEKKILDMWESYDCDV